MYGAGWYRARVACFHRVACVLVLAGSLGACAIDPPLYGWGSYETQLYTLNARPGELAPREAARQLEQESAEIRAAGQRLPPGWYAHLASLYDQMGDIGEARRLLLLEKASFPESAILIDRLVANLDGKRGK